MLQVEDLKSGRASGFPGFNGEDINDRQWRIKYLRELKSSGYFTVTKRAEMKDLMVGTVVIVPLSFLKRNERQPRLIFKNLEELRDSVLLKNDVNIPIAITIRTDDNGLPFGMIVGGERRFRAAEMAKLKQVSCLIKPPMNDRELFDASAVDNIGKEPLTPLEEALVVHRYTEEFGLTDEEIAKRLAKSPQTIRNIRRYLDLVPKIIEKLFKNEITRAEALILSKFDPDNQLKVYEILKEVKERAGKASTHPNEIDVMVIREAEAKGIRRVSSAKRGKCQESSIDLVLRKIVRAANNFSSVMEMAKKINKEEAERAKIKIVDLLGDLEDAQKSLGEVISMFNRWD